MAETGEPRSRHALALVLSEAGRQKEAYEILRKYGVTHVVLGGLERRTYPNSDAIARFPFLSPVVSGDTEVFTVARPR